RPIELRPAAEVQRFIDDERAETSFDPRYHDAYEGRFIEPGDLDEVFDEEDPGPLEELLAREEALYGEELAAVMASHRQHLEEARQIEMALRSAGGSSGTVRLRSGRVTKAEAEARMKEIEALAEANRSYLAGWDQDVLRAHAGLAAHVDAHDEPDRW